ncbi:hypothetical protein DXT99_25845 [Pontibacter diazotrophicus]|uniref:Uncharacterized protein n=1 Tax=Pontibacter diazotrophicus TaxID=1400979 RepID=A0A3D8KZU3_9BACT|nr:hypothetical protein [Pontibacter diazotrophicus]RDV10734.1 hypothetical protein DXT99_25845 [Pontibacter diazotrophicus]
MRIPRTLKRIQNYFGAIFFASICFFTSFLAFQNSAVDLSEADYFSGRIIDKGITASKSSISGAGSVTSNVFYIKIEGLNQTIATYNPSQNYGFLDEYLSIGDNVGVYFIRSADSQKPNLNTLQIEKDGKQLLAQDEYQGKEKTAGYLGMAGGVLMLGLGVWMDKKKYRKKRRTTSANKVQA